jgi:hypothetical protein
MEAQYFGKDFTSQNGLTDAPASSSHSNEWVMLCRSVAPQLIRDMRNALEDVMTRVSAEYVTAPVKVYLAECILKAAAQMRSGATSAIWSLTAAKRTRRGHERTDANDQVRKGSQGNSFRATAGARLA